MKRCSNINRPWRHKSAILIHRSHLRGDCSTSLGKRTTLRKRKTFRIIKIRIKLEIRSKRTKVVVTGKKKKKMEMSLSSHWRESWKISITLSWMSIKNCFSRSKEQTIKKTYQVPQRISLRKNFCQMPPFWRNPMKS